MQEITGAAASIGFASLGLLALLVWFVHLSGFGPLVLQTTEGRFIPKPQKMDQAEADAIYKRQKRSAEDVAEYAEILSDMGIDIGLTLRFATEILVDEIYGKKGTPEEDTVVATDNVAYLRLASDETEEDRVSVRATKRRYNLAAKSLGFDELSWREPQGWLIGRVVQTTAQKLAKEAAAKEAASDAAAVAQAQADAAEDEAEEDEDEDGTEESTTTTRTVASGPARPRRRR